jgi:prevent-host-death family protein
MKQINVYEAKTRLSELIRDVLAGEEVVIARHGTPAVRLVPYTKSKPVQPGFLKGRVRWTEDFDEPLPDFDEYS